MIARDPLQRSDLQHHALEIVQTRFVAPNGSLSLPRTKFVTASPRVAIRFNARSRVLVFDVTDKSCGLAGSIDLDIV